MHLGRNGLLPFLYITIANSFPNFLSSWDSQLSPLENIAFSGFDVPTLGASDSQDIVSSDSGADSLLSFNEDPLPNGSGYDETTSPFLQDLDETTLKPSFADSKDDGTTPSYSDMGDKTELVMDDICNLGYWNRCCRDGVCYWGKFAFQLGIRSI